MSGVVNVPAGMFANHSHAIEIEREKMFNVLSYVRSGAAQEQEKREMAAM